jgi:hypothetical protein
MPSPFPGMDPFLEHPACFLDLHGSLITYVRETLQHQLPDPYYAVINERLWVETSERLIEPDVDVLRPNQGSPREGALGGVAVAMPTRSQPLIIEVPHDERREGSVDIRIRDKDANERIVTTIEVLSLTNKTPGEKGRELYVRKQQELIDSPATHLVEIDLLRGGVHTTAVSRERIQKKGGLFDYHVVVHRFNEWERFYVYTVMLPERLPEIPIPLLPGDSDVSLNLQEVFDRCYDAGPYRRRVRYELARLVPPLAGDQMDWAASCLREKGLLSA